MATAYTMVHHDGGEDPVAIEEPLEIRVDGEPLAVTMRTPGHDDELALGFLYSEGLIADARRAEPTEDFAANVIEVAGPLRRDPGRRRFYTTSSCGVCGKGALEEVAVDSAPLPPGPLVARSLVAALPDRLEQPGHQRTGGRTPPACSTAPGGSAGARGRRTSQRDGQGDRRALLEGWLPLSERLLCVSGRLSFELVQKAAVAGAPILVGVGAPSSLAIALAEDRRMTLCGFARGTRVNVLHPSGTGDGLDG